MNSIQSRIARHTVVLGVVFVANIAVWYAVSGGFSLLVAGFIAGIWFCICVNEVRHE